MPKRLRLNGVKTLLRSETVHLSVAKGNAKSNLEYCTKAASRQEGTSPVVLGEIQEAGKRKISELIDNYDTY